MIAFRNGLYRLACHEVHIGETRSARESCTLPGDLAEAKKIFADDCKIHGMLAVSVDIRGFYNSTWRVNFD